MVLSQQSIDALNSYGQIMLDNDIAINMVLFITILQNKQKAPCLSREIHLIHDEYISLLQWRNSCRVRGNVIDKNFV